LAWAVFLDMSGFATFVALVAPIAFFAIAGPMAFFATIVALLASFVDGIRRRATLGRFNNETMAINFVALEIIHRIVGVARVLKFHKSIVRLERNVANATIFSEQTLNFPFTKSSWKVTHVDTGARRRRRRRREEEEEERE